MGSADVGAGVRDILMNTWPGRFDADQLGDDRYLGEDGLGLDSIEIVEVLVACQDRWPRPLHETLLTEAALTIERVVAYFTTP